MSMSEFVLEARRGRGQRKPVPARVARLAILCVALVGLLAVAGGRGSTARAQVEPEASPVMNPTMGECVAGEGTPMATVEETAIAAATPAATPAGSPATTPTPTPAPVGTPVEGAMADDAIAAAQNLAFCWNAGDLDGVLSLVTPNLLQDKFGAADAAAATELLTGMGELPPYTILGAGNVQTWDDGRASVDLVYLLGEYQFVEARWFLVMAGDQMLIDEEVLLPSVPEGDINFIVPFGVANDASPVLFGTSTSSRVTTADILTLHGRNCALPCRAPIGQRVFFVVRVADDPAAGTPAADEFDPAAGEFIGTLSLAGNEEGDIALVNLDPGVYALYDAAVEGSVASLIVAEPEA